MPTSSSRFGHGALLVYILFLGCTQNHPRSGQILLAAVAATTEARGAPKECVTSESSDAFPASKTCAYHAGNNTLIQIVWEADGPPVQITQTWLRVPEPRATDIADSVGRSMVVRGATPLPWPSIPRRPGTHSQWCANGTLVALHIAETDARAVPWVSVVLASPGRDLCTVHTAA